MRILFMCVANSARSQMAEGLAKSIFQQNAEIESAGSQPKFVHPFAKQVLAEIGIDISSHSSKSWNQLPEPFRKNLNMLITLCAEEVCPTGDFNTGQRLHWPLLDPAGAGETDEEQLTSFRKVRDEIKGRLEQLKSTI